MDFRWIAWFHSVIAMDWRDRVQLTEICPEGLSFQYVSLFVHDLSLCVNMSHYLFMIFPSCSISVADALPLLIKKFECFKLTAASPISNPLHPALSINSAAK